MALMVIGVILLWLRIINFFRYNEYLGKFIGIVRNLVSELALFFGLYLINLLFFAIIGELCFFNIRGYETVADAFRTLFFASYGSIEFLPLEEAILGPRIGYSYIFIFLLVNIGIFLSFFVAIITVLFQSYEENESVYQMIETLKIRSVT